MSAVLHALVAFKGSQTVAVDLLRGPEIGQEFFIQRDVGTGGKATLVLASQMLNDDHGALTTYGGPTGFKAGDLVEVQLAVREPAATGSLSKEMAARVVDLRTGTTYVIGPAALLRSAPRAPVSLARSSGDNVAVTSATWAEGWPRSFAGLGREASASSPNVYIRDGVGQHGRDFFVSDKAHRHAVAIGTVRLGVRVRVRDLVTVSEETAPTGTTTAVSVTDARTGKTVTSSV